jgi:hypothetical protein
VEVLHSVADLAEYTIYLGSTHLLRHDNTEEVEWSILHNLRYDLGLIVARETKMLTS